MPNFTSAQEEDVCCENSTGSKGIVAVCVCLEAKEKVLATSSSNIFISKLLAANIAML